MIEFYPEGQLIDKLENVSLMSSMENLQEACQSRKILEARAVMCDSNHNLIVDMGIMKGIIPREEGAIGMSEAQKI